MQYLALLPGFPHASQLYRIHGKRRASGYRHRYSPVCIPIRPAEIVPNEFDFRNVLSAHQSMDGLQRSDILNRIRVPRLRIARSGPALSVFV